MRVKARFSRPNEFSRCQFTTGGIFWSRLGKDRWCSAAGSKVSRGRIMAILTEERLGIFRLLGLIALALAVYIYVALLPARL